MNQKRILVWILIWAGVIFVVIFVRAKPIQQVKVQKQAPEVSSVAVASSQVAGSGEPAWGRDPFVLGEFSETFSPESRLTGIIYDEARPQESFAIVEGELVRVGDVHDNWRVIQIEKDRVVLEIDGKREELLLKPPE